MKTDSSQTTVNCRQPPLRACLAAAAQAVAAVLAGHTPDATLLGLPLALRPATTDLAMNALRDYGRGDFFLARLMSRPPREPTLRALLLVALARLERRPAAAHTLVDQAVAAAPPRHKALVNAVLRNFLRQMNALIAAADADPVAATRHPGWWLAELRQTYPEAWPRIVAQDNAHPPMCLRVNRRRIAADEYRRLLEQAGLAIRRQDGEAIWLLRPVPVARLPGFAAGLVSAQDWGAQQAAHLLDLADGQRVLDACAAPGNKTAHLLESADLEATAIDLDDRRLRSVAATLDRLGLAATLRAADAEHPETWWDGRPFDRILLDAPCSASGVARRHPDAKWLRRPDDVARFARRQARLLAALWPLLSPGGKMLYATCSLFAAENGDVVRAFCAARRDVRRLPTGGADVEMQLLPSADHDGFYYALLEKMA